MARPDQLPGPDFHSIAQNKKIAKAKELVKNGQKYVKNGCLNWPEAKEGQPEPKWANPALNLNNNFGKSC